MRNYAKLAAVFACLIAGFMCAGGAQASITTTLGNWWGLASHQVVDGDKTYTLEAWSSNLPGDLPVVFTSPTWDVHLISIGDAGHAQGFGTYTVSYTVTITNLLRYFNTARLDVDENDPVTADKVITDGGSTEYMKLTSTNGSPDSKPFPAGVQFIDVAETITVASGGYFFSTTDRYTEYENEIPEPASLAVWGCLSALGLVVGWRNRRRVL